MSRTNHKFPIYATRNTFRKSAVHLYVESLRDNWRSERSHSQFISIEICGSYMSVLLYVQQIPEAVAMWRLQIKRSRVRFPHWNFFFHSFFFCLISPSPPFFFRHARSAISMLKHFSNVHCIMHIVYHILQVQSLLQQQS